MQLVRLWCFYELVDYINLSSLCYQVHHLAVNALLKSSQINELEGGALLGFNSESQDAVTLGVGQTNWDESVSCAPAFRVLKQLVQGWLSDAVQSGNTFADALLQHLYRWLCRCVILIPLDMKDLLHLRA
jgi:hypothetical protein